MKRIELVLFMLSIVLCAYAQHMTFIGIPLGQSQETVDRALKQKGFKYTGEALEPAHMYEGPFWIYPKVTVLARTYNRKVTEIIVTINDQNADAQQLIRNISKKYGKYKSIDKGLFWDSYNWSARYGNVQVTINSTFLTVRYIDNTSRYYVNHSGSRNRNRNDDL